MTADPPVPPTRPAPRIRTPAPHSAWKADGLMALALGAASALMGTLALMTGAFGPGLNTWSVIFGGFLMAAPLVFRRRWPSAMVIVQTLVYMPLVWLGWELYIIQIMLFMAFYSVGAWDANRRRANIVRIVVLLMMAGSMAATYIVFFDIYLQQGGVIGLLSTIGIQVVVNAGYFGGAWVFGNRSWASAIKREELEQAHDAIRAQQAIIADHAVDLERVRIARELHDVVAHHVSAMGIQAGAARRVMSKDPERAEKALRLVESSARDAIGELRTMVTTLRSDGAPNAPLPTIDELDALVQSAVDSGQQATLERIGTLPEVSPAAELTLYRVAQEGLTNARKHAGHGATVAVRLRGVGDGIELEISDSGGPAGGRAEGTGHGLIGMRERISAVGGTVTAGPKSAGGWLVRAYVPRSPAHAVGLGESSDLDNAEDGRIVS